MSVASSQRSLAAGPDGARARQHIPQPRQRPKLQVVPHAPRRAAKAPFVVLVLSLLTAGLLALLLLNTVLAQDSFVLHALEKRTAELADEEQALQEQVAAEAAPQVLAPRARALGMVPSQNPVFLRLADGRILGVPRPAVAPVVPKTAATPAAKPRTTPAAKPRTTPVAKPRTTPAVKPGVKPAKPGAKPAKRGATRSGTATPPRRTTPPPRP
jgi:cell division protein FtsB